MDNDITLQPTIEEPVVQPTPEPEAQVAEPTPQATPEPQAEPVSDKEQIESYFNTGKLIDKPVEDGGQGEGQPESNSDPEPKPQPEPTDKTKSSDVSDEIRKQIEEDAIKKFEQSLIDGTNHKSADSLKKSALSASKTIQEKSETVKALEQQISDLTQAQKKVDDAKTTSEKADAEKEFAELKDELSGYSSPEAVELMAKMVDMKLSNVNKKSDEQESNPKLSDELIQSISDLVNKNKQQEETAKQQAYNQNTYSEAIKMIVQENQGFDAKTERELLNFLATDEDGIVIKESFQKNYDSPEDAVLGFKKGIQRALTFMRGKNFDSALKAKSNEIKSDYENQLNKIQTGKAVVKSRHANHQPARKQQSEKLSDHQQIESILGFSTKL